MSSHLVHMRPKEDGPAMRAVAFLHSVAKEWDFALPQAAGWVRPPTGV